MSKYKIREEAAHFVTRLHSGEITGREEAELNAWRQRSEAHESEFQAMLATWDLTAQLYQEPERAVTPKKRLVKTSTWFVGAIAASILAVVVVPLALDFFNTPPGNPKLVGTTPESPPSTPEVIRDVVTFDDFRISEHEYSDVDRAEIFTSAVGEVRHIKLADGSTISLNTDTTLTVEVRANQRLVTLTKGEAFFDVAHDENRPFVIDTGDQIIRVLGTQFNVRKRDDEAILQVAVVQGRVSIARNKERTTETQQTEPKDNLLAAGDIGAFGPESELISQNDVAEVNTTQSWRHGVFRFENESLEQVVRELNRYRNRKIHIVDAEANALRISGVFHLKNGENILLALESSLPVRIVRESEYVFIHQQ